ncbi:MAG: hypothetical protein AB7W59_24560 [Acidimicrobiia bacterium]
MAGGDLLAGPIADGPLGGSCDWVHDASCHQPADDQRLQLLDDLLATYEAESGEITSEETDGESHRIRGRAVVVRADRMAG